MTIEEAIKILENRKKQPFISYQQKEAFQMGINALKKELKDQKGENEDKQHKS